MTFINNIYGAVAQCNFDADGAAAAFRTQRGFLAAFTRNGVGDYSLTMDQPQDVTNICPKGTPIENIVAVGSGVMICVEIVSTTVLRIRCFSNAGAAAEADFALSVFKNGPN